MTSSLEVLRARERLRVAKDFLSIRPRVAALGAFSNVYLLKSDDIPHDQARAMVFTVAVMVGAFFVEAQWLRRHPLSERWLLASLSLTLLMLSLAAAVSGGLVSPVLPLVFAPIVIGVAAFGGPSQRMWFLGGAILAFVVLTFGPWHGFPQLPLPERIAMLLTNSMVSLALLAHGVIGLVDAHSNVSEQLERLRQDTVLEAERRSASVEHLGAEVAHEVKNPLAAARGLVQLVTRNTTDAREIERLDVVVREIDRALQVLGDYLSFSKPLSKLELTPVNLKSLLQDVAGVLEARAYEKSLELVVVGSPVRVLADRQRLRDAVLNLALNAVAALPNGGKLGLRSSANGEKALLEVADNGPGVSAELAGRLGKPFASETEGGTGLGIMLAQSIIKQHGGELRFEPRRGGGIRALLELPRALETA